MHKIKLSAYGLYCEWFINQNLLRIINYYQKSCTTTIDYAVRLALTNDAHIVIEQLHTTRPSFI